MAHTAFPRTAAQAKVGKRVRTRIALAEQVLDGYDVEVAWGWSGRRTPWINWMTKAEYEVCLMELRAPRDDRPPSHSRAAPASRCGRPDGAAARRPCRSPSGPP
jgi:hypothetical protein